MVEIFLCSLCRMDLPSELTLNGHKYNEHSRDIHILDIESFDQLEPSVRPLSGIYIADDTTKKEYLENLKTFIIESVNNLFHTKTRTTML